MADNPFTDELADVELPILQDEPKKDKKPAPAPSASSLGNSKEDLKERYEALKKREESIKKRRQDLTNQAEQGPQQNWPSFFPILRYSPEIDLPQAARRCVKLCFIGLIIFTIHTFWNIVAVLSVKGISDYKLTKNIVMGILQGVAGFYVFLKFGYQSLYVCCAKHDIQIRWTVIQIAIIGWSIYLLIGFPDSGCVGIAVFLDLIAKSTSVWAKIAAFVNTALLGSNLFCQFATFLQSQQYQKVSGKEDNAQLTNPDQIDTPLNL
ncbi:hypothetical protein TVAG_388820 [Trichomonas vaginalis G3]|uniref:Secretory carrier membrane protein n=1 Tax=Trichomonas vaginalis (strain ATCC PRA-98 / G3) TaxID=412133 RepID=A2DYL4_TRIV3|nr:protein transport [Trichomonas vaginalis G3]EAY14549.1 hypothetical protein TVAG_388820 [Trichomonas vaginalis G3]KAI5529283.1 protein transport [Trichomonas vaginalis G3]|eukprot:XP_001326772.1 hypothetical protein [Trichomonas vaginalis G3]